MTDDYRSFRQLWLPKDGMVLATFYNGIGDAIVHAPVVVSLRRAIGEGLVLPETQASELTDLVPELQGMRRVPGHFRKFHSIQHGVAIGELKAAGINAILNFRRDRVAARQQYESFSTALTGAGIHNRDACESLTTTHTAPVHTFRLATDFLGALGIPFERPPRKWLAPFVAVELNRQLELGVFLGASVPIKRMSARFWHMILCGLAERLALRPLLIAGDSEDEQRLADELSRALARDGVAHSVAAPGNLRQVAGMIAGLRGVLTGDSFVLPLAEAVGTPVIGIHCATDSRVYGVQGRLNLSVQSPFYAVCPARNSVGNCDGWDQGCAHLRCQLELDVAATVEAASAFFDGQQR